MFSKKNNKTIGEEKMKDINGVELKVGDKVVFVQGVNYGARLAIGKITKIYPSKNGNGEACSIGKSTHIYENRIMKL